MNDKALAAIPPRFPAVPMDQIEYLIRAVADQQIHCVVTFAGQVDAGRMARAVRLTLDAEPVLGCRFVEHPQRPYWERRDDLDRLSLCPVVEPDDVEAALWRFIATPVDPYADPQVQTSIFRADRDTLCVKVDHVAVDAGGTMEYMALLASIYQALAADPAYRPQPNLRGSRGQGQVFRRFGPLTLLRAYRRRASPPAAWGLPAIGRDLSRRTFAVRWVGPARFAAFKAYGRQRQASVNDVLLAAFYRALFEVLDPPAGVPLPVQVPINLRRYLPDGRGEAICNLAGATYPAIIRQPRATFDDTLASVHAAMEEAKTGHPDLGGALYLQLGFTLFSFARVKRMAHQMMARAAESGRAHPFLSNFGVIEPRWVDFGDEVVDAYGVGPVLYPPGFMIAVTTFQGTMTFTVGFCETATDRRIVDRVLDILIRELPES